MDAIDVIRELRKRGLSQQSIAERTGLSQGAISHIETGRRKNVFATTKDALVGLFEQLLREQAEAASVENEEGA